MATKNYGPAVGSSARPAPPRDEVKSMEELLREVLTAVTGLLDQHICGQVSDELFTHTLKGLIEYANKRLDWLIRENHRGERGKTS